MLSPRSSYGSVIERIGRAKVRVSRRVVQVEG
jgi:hypothetical protein